MRRQCEVCGKQQDDMALVRVFRALEDSTPSADGTQAVTAVQQTVCVWCIKAEAATRELYPDWDNLTVCPRCHDREILRTQGVCGACMSEVQAHYG